MHVSTPFSPFLPFSSSLSHAPWEVIRKPRLGLAMVLGLQLYLDGADGGRYGAYQEHCHPHSGQAQRLRAFAQCHQGRCAVHWQHIKMITKAAKVFQGALVTPRGSLAILLFLNKANGAFALQSQIVMLITSKKQSELFQYLS